MPQPRFSRRQALVVLGVLAVLLVVGGRLLLRSGSAEQAAPAAAPAETAPAPEPEPRVVVDVVGAVLRPGLYRLPQSARIADALARAGGPTRKADIEQVNLAAPLVDGEQVVVPRKIAGVPAAATGGESGAAPAGPVHLSTATLEQLDALPGVGPVTAQKILDFRAQHGAFRSVEELDAIPGIGPARIDQLRGLVVP